MPKLLSDKILGENIRRLRIAAGLTQEQTVAKLQLLGSPISRSTYAIIEMGRGNLFVSDLVGLRIIFKAEYEDFFQGITPERGTKESGTILPSVF